MYLRLLECFNNSVPTSRSDSLEHGYLNELNPRVHEVGFLSMSHNAGCILWLNAVSTDSSFLLCQQLYEGLIHSERLLNCAKALRWQLQLSRLSARQDTEVQQLQSKSHAMRLCLTKTTFEGNRAPKLHHHCAVYPGRIRRGALFYVLACIPKDSELMALMSSLLSKTLTESLQLATTCPYCWDWSTAAACSISICILLTYLKCSGFQLEEEGCIQGVMLWQTKRKC